MRRMLVAEISVIALRRRVGSGTDHGSSAMEVDQIVDHRTRWRTDGFWPRNGTGPETTGPSAKGDVEDRVELDAVGGDAQLAMEAVEEADPGEGHENGSGRRAGLGVEAGAGGGPGGRYLGLAGARSRAAGEGISVIMVCWPSLTTRWSSLSASSV
jgi:hypothetical protein